MMFKSAALITFMLQTENISCFTPNAKISNRPFNIDTELDGYLDSLAPEVSQGSGPSSYMASGNIVTNPKASTVSSYLDNVGGAPEPVAPSSYAPPAEPAPAAYEYSAPSAGASSEASNAYDYTNTYTHTDEATQQTHTHTHHHLHSYTYVYDNDSVTIEDDQKVDVEVSVSGGAASYSTPVASGPDFAEPTGSAGGVATGSYLGALASNVLASGGGTSLGNFASSYAVTGPQCQGFKALGNPHLDTIPVTAPGASGYSTLSNFASQMNGAVPLSFDDYPTEPAAPEPVAYSAPATPTSAPAAAGDYLSALGSNTMVKPSGGTALGNFASMI